MSSSAALTPRAKVPLLAPEEQSKSGWTLSVPDLNLLEHYAADRSVGSATPAQTNLRTGRSLPQGEEVTARTKASGHLRVEIDPRFAQPGSTPGRQPERGVGYRVVGEAFSIRLTERRLILDQEISVRSPDGERCRSPGQGDCIRKWPSAGASSQIVTAGRR